jgi:SAM-dependent methyltransferase
MKLPGRVGHLVGQAWLALTTRSSGDYWETRYRLGMSSGCGSSGELARFKADVLNNFVREHGVRSVIEFGCGDGQQLALAQYPRYLGLDVSRTAISLCSRRFAGDPTKSFLWVESSQGGNLGEFLRADLTISLDVIYHLLEDRVYESYLKDLFGAARRHVVVYSSNRDESVLARHVRHRKFLDDVGVAHPEFRLAGRTENPLREQSFADFYFFARTGA